MTPDTIRALTPIALAGIGGIIAVLVITIAPDDSNKWSAGMGLAGTAIAGAAGLANAGKNDDYQAKKSEKAQNISQKSPS